MSLNPPFQQRRVELKFDAYPSAVKQRLLFIRQLIFEVAASHPEVGRLEETLKWDEPSYLTSDTGSGSTVRMDWKKSTPNQYYVYFHCQTNLVETFKQIYGEALTYEGNRSLIFQMDESVAVDVLADCIAMALTYHLVKKRRS